MKRFEQYLPRLVYFEDYVEMVKSTFAFNFTLKEKDPWVGATRLFQGQLWFLLKQHVVCFFHESIERNDNLEMQQGNLIEPTGMNTSWWTIVNVSLITYHWFERSNTLPRASMHFQIRSSELPSTATMNSKILTSDLPTGQNDRYQLLWQRNLL